MKTMIAIVMAALVLPVAFADPTPQVGVQTGQYWSEAATIDVQAGTGFQLHGIVGDHDIFFYSASGSFVGYSINCGSDSGVVPASAASAEILVWDHVGELSPCGSAPVTPPASVFVYVDGL